MASSDTTVAISQIDDAIVLSDGTGTPLTLTLALVKSSATWTVPNPTKAEMRPRDLHHSTPTLRKTGDGNVTGSLKLYIASFKGNSTKTPYEVFTDSASWVTVGAGDGALVKMVITYTAAGAGGATQTATFAYCHFANVAVSYEDGLLCLSCDFTDLENKPAIA